MYFFLDTIFVVSLVLPVRFLLFFSLDFLNHFVHIFAKIWCFDPTIFLLLKKYKYVLIEHRGSHHSPIWPSSVTINGRCSYESLIWKTYRDLEVMPSRFIEGYPVYIYEQRLIIDVFRLMRPGLCALIIQNRAQISIFNTLALSQLVVRSSGEFSCRFKVHVMNRVGICYFSHYLGGGSGLDWMVSAQSNLYPHYTQLHYHPSPPTSISWSTHSAPCCNATFVFFLIQALELCKKTIRLFLGEILCHFHVH